MMFILAVCGFFVVATASFLMAILVSTLCIAVIHLLSALYQDIIDLFKQNNDDRV